MYILHVLKESEMSNVCIRHLLAIVDLMYALDTCCLL